MVFQGARTPIRRPGKSAIRWPIFVPEGGFGRNGRAPETAREGRLRRGVCGLRLTRSLERFRAKWIPVRVKKRVKIKDESLIGSDSIRPDKAFRGATFGLA
jgi:hypothetical protein